MFVIMLAHRIEPNNRMIKRVLAEQANEIEFIEVSPRMNDVISAAKKVKPDILIMCQKLYDALGTQVLDEIKKEKKRGKTTHVIITSGDLEYETIREAFRKGADDFFVEPLKPKEILDSINVIMEKVLEERIKGLQSDAYERKMKDYNILSEYAFFYNIIFNEKSEFEHRILSELVNAGKFGFVISFSLKKESVSIHRNFIEIQKKVRSTLKNQRNIYTKMGPLIGSGMNVYVSCDMDYNEDRVKMNNLLHWTTKEVYDLFVNMGIKNIKAGVGKIYPIEEIEKSYIQSLSALAIGEDAVNIYEEVASKEKLDGELCRNVINSLVDGMSFREEELSVHMIKRFGAVINSQKSGTSRNVGDAVGFATEYIRNNYKEDVTLKDVANLCGVSVQYLSKVFKEEMGINFIDYLNSYRIRKAKELMYANKTSIKEICFEVGYNDPNYFSRIFKKSTGKTPRGFVQSLDN